MPKLFVHYGEYILLFWNAYLHADLKFNLTTIMIIKGGGEGVAAGSKTATLFFVNLFLHLNQSFGTHFALQRAVYILHWVYCTVNCTWCTGYTAILVSTADTLQYCCVSIADDGQWVDTCPWPPIPSHTKCTSHLLYQHISHQLVEQ